MFYRIDVFIYPASEVRYELLLATEIEKRRCETVTLRVDVSHETVIRVSRPGTPPHPPHPDRS